MPARTLAGCRGIVTGASSGIGRAIALGLVRAGAQVVAVARSCDALEETARLATGEGAVAGRMEILAGDITQPPVRQAAIDKAQAAFGGLDLLINNAGASALGRFENADESRLRRIMEVNFFAPVELIRAALPVLRAGRRPLVVNVASILAHRGIPHNAEYCASKFALRGFSESIRPELARHGIDVLVVSPGTTDTDFFSHVLASAPTPWPRQRGVTAEWVAKRTLRAIRRGKREIVVNWRGGLLVWLNRLAPRMVDRWIERYG